MSFAEKATLVATRLLAENFGSLAVQSSDNSRNLQAFTCPFPLLPATPENTNFLNVSQFISCGFRCEGTMFDQEDIDDFSRAQIIFAAVGQLTSLFVFLTWGMFPVKAKQKMTFWISFASVLVTSVALWPSVFKGSGSGVWCKDELEPRRQTDGPSSCVLQGFAVIFFGLVLACWWWCSCFDLFCKLFLRKRDIQHYLTYYHIFSWTLPFVCAIAILITGKYGYEQPRLWCFLSPEAPDAYEYVFFYAWVGALWVSGDIMMFLVVWSLIAHSRSFKKKNPTTNYFKKLSMYKTPLFFVFIFSFFWAVFFTFVVLTDVQTPQFEESAGSWISCLIGSVLLSNGTITNPAVFTLSNFTNLLVPQPEGEQLGCGDVQPGRISIGLMWTTVFILSGNGILVFLVFGLQGENYVLWVNYLASGCSREAVAVERGGERQLSTFQEHRRAIARMNIKFCQWFAGNNMADVLTGKDLLRKSNVKNPDKPLLSDDDKSVYTARYADNIPVSPVASVSYPRASYQRDNQGSPTRGSQPTSLEQFYRTSSNNTPGQLPLQAPVRGRNDQPAQRNAQYTVGGWDDIFNDPLWGVNVEF